MAIEISAADVKAIRGHGEAAFPNECCGFMLGKVDGDSRRVEELKSADNDREDKAQYNRFLITPEAFMRGEKAAREKDLDIIGFYHSHPDAPARPSQYDLEHAWPWYSYVIVAIKSGEADAMTSWVLQEDRQTFGEEDIVERS